MKPKIIPIRQLRYHWPLYLFILPAAALLFTFQYLPAVTGIFHSFFRWNGSDISEYVGWDNYHDLLSNSEFWQSFKVALLLGTFNVLKMIPPLAVAVCIHRCRSQRIQFFYRTMFVVPMVIPGLVIALIWRSFFFESTSGYLNRFLISTGAMNVLGRLDAFFGWGGVFAAGRSPAWLGEPRLILVACIVWGFPWVGSFAVLIHLARLQAIPKSLYEACEIDGAGWWTKFARLELPMMLSSLYLVFVFVIIDTIKDAGTIIALAGFEGGPGGVATVPALFMIRKAFIDQQMGYACAVGIVLMVLILATQKLATSLVEWEDHSPAKRRLLQLLIAVLLIALGGLVSIWLLAACAAITLAIVWARRHRRPIDWDPGPSTWCPPPRKPHSPIRRAVADLWPRLLKHGYIWFILLMALLPLYLMLIVSGKENVQFYAAPATVTLPFHWENWSAAARLVMPTVANSIFISGFATIITLVLALLAAYFFARLRLPAHGLLWNALLLLMMLPAIANLVPLFRILHDLNLLNTLTALILVGASGAIVFAVFVLRAFIADIPQDLFEAAEIDGASHWRQLHTVVTPLSGAVLGTIAITVFVNVWNDFVLPLIIMRDQARLPVMVQLIRMAGEYIKYWGPMMAGYSLASIPIVVLFMLSMKLFIRGLTEGAVKG